MQNVSSLTSFLCRKKQSFLIKISLGQLFVMQRDSCIRSTVTISLCFCPKISWDFYPKMIAKPL